MRDGCEVPDEFTISTGALSPLFIHMRSKHNWSLKSSGMSPRMPESQAPPARAPIRDRNITFVTRQIMNF
jgi:hypothetical protein